MKQEWSLENRDSDFIESMMSSWSWLYQHYFKVETSGWHNIPTRNVLLVGSHNGGLPAPDLAMLMYDWFRRFGTKRLIYGLMHADMWEMHPNLAIPSQKMGAVPAHPKIAMQALEREATILVFPGGARDVFRPFSQWDKIFLNKQKGFIKLALTYNIPIVPIVTVGAHHTLLVLGDLAPLLQNWIDQGMPWPFKWRPEVVPVFIGAPFGLTIGPFPNIPFPKKIYTRICKPLHFTYEGVKKGKAYRSYIDDCYQQVEQYMQKELNLLINESSYKKEDIS